MGLQPSEDIDAFAFDEQREIVAFSTRSPHRDPLLSLSIRHDLDTAPRVIKRRDGTPVSRRLGLGGFPDDIDGFCFKDPRGPRSRLTPMMYGRPLTVPGGNIAGPNPSMKILRAPGPELVLLLRDRPSNWAGVYVAPRDKTLPLPNGAEILSDRSLTHLFDWGLVGLSLRGEERRVAYPHLPSLIGQALYFQTIGITGGPGLPGDLYASEVVEVLF